MSSNVFRFVPQAANLENIPHMLRLLATAIENGDHGEVSGMLIVMPPDAGDWPSCFGFGEDEALGDVVVVGMLELAKAFIVNNATGRK